MAEPRTLGSYGAPYQDEHPVENPQTQISAALMNRNLEDQAQMTRTAWRAIVKFTAIATAAVTIVPAGSVLVRTAWGDSSAFKPVITKTTTGLYSVAFAASYIDGLGVTENVSWFAGKAEGHTNNASDDPEGTRIVSLGATLVTLVTKVAGVVADQAASGQFVSVTLFLT